MGRGRAELGVERLEHLIRSRDQRHPRDLVRTRAHAGPCLEAHGVADPGLKRRRHLLVEDHRAGAQLALEQTEGVESPRVVARDREHGSVRRARVAGGAAVGGADERRRGRGRGMCDPALATDGAGEPQVLPIGGDRALPVERHHADRGPRRDAKRVPDEEDHPAEKGGRDGNHRDPQQRPGGTPYEPREGEPSVKRDCVHDSIGPWPVSWATRSARAATSVRRDHERKAQLPLERLDHVEHPGAGVGVELPGGLVTEQELRTLGERPRHRNSLGFSARELSRESLSLSRQAHQTKQGAGRRSRPVLPLDSDPRRERDVLPRGQGRK